MAKTAAEVVKCPAIENGNRKEAVKSEMAPKGQATWPPPRAWPDTWRRSRKLKRGRVGDVAYRVITRPFKSPFLAITARYWPSISILHAYRSSHHNGVRPADIWRRVLRNDRNINNAPCLLPLPPSHSCVPGRVRGARIWAGGSLGAGAHIQALASVHTH